MVLGPGARLGAYEIVSALGAGGMGEVYRATDTKLKRQVAIKILPASLAAFPDRLARFQREAEVLASLNHPHIAAIYGLENADGVKALVMELVEGDDLAQRIERGPIPLEEALSIARQIAEALEAAHEKGIIHRDLKPANIKVRPDGTVKVLDFGLAKFAEASGSDVQPSHHHVTQSPTITSPAMMTSVGTILGTAAYMAPEQARGRVVDKRADVWAFGCIVYEMLTGARAFAGDDVTDTIAAIMRDDPKWDALPPATPPHIRLLLKRCLQRDHRARIADISTARFLIEELPNFHTPSATAIGARVAPSRGAVWVVAAGGLLLGVLASAVVGWLLVRPAPVVRGEPIRFPLVPPENQIIQVQTSDDDLAISSDGTLIAARAGSANLTARLFVRAVGDTKARPILGTEGARGPFFSPDGRWLGFFLPSGQLAKVSMAGGSPIVLCNFAGVPRGASWGDGDTIVFATNIPDAGLLTVPAAGGNPKAVSKPAENTNHFFPAMLPGGQAVLVTVMSLVASTAPAVAVLDLASGQLRTLIRGGFHAQYVDPGHLVYAADFNGALRAVRFDPATLRTIGESVPLVEQVLSQSTGTAKFAVSRSGALVYVASDASSQIFPMRTLVWVNRQGREEPIKVPLHSYATARLSPDGTRTALDVRDQNSDLWIWDFARQTLTRLTTDPANDLSPVWMPDGRRLVFASSRNGNPNLYLQSSDGTGTVERLTTGALPEFPTSVSADGVRILFFELSGAPDIFMLTRRDPPKREKLIQTAATETNAEISPDGRWVAYQSNDSGTSEIYVRPFPDVNSGRWQVSPDGGTRPAWLRSGKELFYLDGKGRLSAVSVAPTAGGFAAGTAHVVLNTAYYGGASVTGTDLRGYDVAPDGQRFLMIKDAAEPSVSGQPTNVTVVLNWIKELEARVPAAK